MRNRSILYFAGFMVAVLGFLMMDYSLRRDYLEKSLQPQAIAETASVEQDEVSDIAQRTRFLNRFKSFTLRMNAVSDDPEKSEELFNQFAQTVNPVDNIALAELLKDVDNRKSERTLALELMVLNQDFNCHNLLNTFVQDEKFGPRADVDFEIALRAQAIEGLTLFSDKKLVRKNLENLKVRTKHAFLYERADHALVYLSDKNIAAQLEASDAKAIKK